MWQKMKLSGKITYNAAFSITVFMMLIFCNQQLKADIIHLKNGGTIEGQVTDHGNRIAVEFSGGSIEINKSDIQQIENKPLPQNIFAGRLKQLIDNTDSNGCIKLAHWAMSKDLQREYVQALRTALLLDKNNSQAEKLLRDYRLRLQELPYNEKAAQKLLSEMGSDFRIMRTRHYRIGYNCSDIFVELTAQRLEDVYGVFLDFFQDRNFEPAPVSDRLEVVLFDNEQQFRAYVKANQLQMSNSVGFYSGKTNRCYFYDSFNDKNYRRNLEKFRQARQQLEDFRQKVSDNDSDIYYTVTETDGSEIRLNKRRMLNRLDDNEAELDEQFQLLRKSYVNKNINVTVHEANHQLSYLCGIFSRYCQTPKWLIEGLAVYFEAANEGHWQKPGEIHPERLKIFLEKHDTSQTITLAQLLTRDKLFNLAESDGKSAYASAWALFYYLVWHQHEKLFDYIYDLSLRMSTEPYSDQERIEDFEKYFGNRKILEKHWRYFMSTLQ